ncbi:hypothetical protein QR680_004852 [Steinernema hermaphroditum]|uniref:Cystatin domain-containing protein n=1 Tax=Steinernema hermaphroditum TaxID=289476 RepID=A0AA39HQ26_9BILA|nr:hypothetical protein QR680_004852 [Steinernema hermaphroditum]
MLNMRLFVFLILPLAVLSFSLFGKKTTPAPKDPHLEELKWIAIKEINAKSKDLLNLVPVEIVTDRQNSFRNTLELKVAQSTCLKRTMNHEQLKEKGCKLKKKGKQFIYTLEIYKRAWEKFQSVTIKSVKEL